MCTGPVARQSASTRSPPDLRQPVPRQLRPGRGTRCTAVSVICRRPWTRRPGRPAATCSAVTPVAGRPRHRARPLVPHRRGRRVRPRRRPCRRRAQLPSWHRLLPRGPRGRVPRPRTRLVRRGGDGPATRATSDGATGIDYGVRRSTPGGAAVVGHTGAPVAAQGPPRALPGPGTTASGTIRKTGRVPRHVSVPTPDRRLATEPLPLHRTPRTTRPRTPPSTPRTGHGNGAGGERAGPAPREPRRPDKRAAPPVP